jgi:predicted dehydrogenase
VDTDESVLSMARTRWHIKYVAKSIKELTRVYQPDIAVIATPPHIRSVVIDQLPSLRAVLVEKPLGKTLDAGQQFLNKCTDRQILVQVNLWRRADDVFRRLAAGHLTELIGKPQAVFGLYGNGLLNNGTHIVDFVSMLLGEIKGVQASIGRKLHVTNPAGPIPDDIQVPFSLELDSGPMVMMQPLQFEYYRENSLDIWGEKARLFISQEGLGVFLYPRVPNRAMKGEYEIASDQAQIIKSTVGQAFYRMYDNLAQAVLSGNPLWCSGDVALKAEQAIEAVKLSAQNNGERISFT